MIPDKIHLLSCGFITVDKGSVLTYHVDTGTRVEIPTFAYLIRTNSGNILFDSGINRDDLPYLSSLGKKIRMPEGDFLLNQLEMLGVSTDDIDFVFQSHLHWDHSGLLHQFKKAEIIIQREEYSYALNHPAFADIYYRRPYYDPAMKWRMIDGDEVLLPGITAVLTPGHTPGHQSLVIHGGDKSAIILSGDCAYTSQNIEKEIIPGVFANPIQALHSMKRLKSLAVITGGKIFYSHETPPSDT